MEVISFPKGSVPYRWRPDSAVTRSLPQWRPAQRPVASTIGRAQAPNLGQPVTPAEVANVTLVTLASVGAGVAGVTLAVVAPQKGVKIAGAIAAAFGISGLLNQIARFSW